jgi:LuxR family maltose regulon positive regulatory protein
MSKFVLATKLEAPQERRTLILRPRLVNLLVEGLASRLILVSAPPGFGKTTLVAGWLRGIDQPFAWLSLEENDNDPVRFLAYLIAALQRVDPALGQGLQPLIGAPQAPPPEALVEMLINELAERGRPAMLVLDNYHLIQNETIHHVLDELIEHQPVEFHLILLSRHDPPLPLPKLRACGQLTEIRETDLRFSEEEAVVFLQEAMHLELAPQDVASLTERTEGWIAGLQLAGLSLQQCEDAGRFIANFRGDDRYILDYLMEEVFRHQSPEIRDFLLQTSILDRMSAPLCELILGGFEQSNGETSLSAGDILEYLERSNLFVIPLDNRRELYRYHHLFADLLRFRLERKYPERLPELHRRASHWFAQAGDPDTAMQHALAIPDHTLAADLAEIFMLTMIGSSRLTAYQQWIAHLPDGLITQRAYLCAGCGWTYSLICQLESAAKHVAAGEAALEFYQPIFSPADKRQISREEVGGHLAAIRAYIARLQGDYSGAVEHSHRALEGLPPEASTVRSVVAFNLGMLHMHNGQMAMAREAFQDALEAAQKSEQNLYIAVSTLCLLGGMAVTVGLLNQAADYYERAIQMVQQESGLSVSMPALSYAYGGLGGVHYQRNELDKAQQHLDTASRLVTHLGMPETIVMADIYQALLALERGDIQLAGKQLIQAEVRMQTHPVRGGILVEWSVSRGEFFLAQGDAASAVQWLKGRGIEAGALSGVSRTTGMSSDQMHLQGTREAEYLLLARALLAQGSIDQATDLFEQVCDLAKTTQNRAVLIEGLVFRAIIACDRRGNSTQALPYLEQALDLAAPEGYVRPFIKAGESLIKLLRQAIAQGIHPAYAHRLLSDLIERERRLGRIMRPPVGTNGRLSSLNTPLEPLTDRERQVLRLLAAGLSSNQVAEELIISVSTVRSYMKSLYQKLDAHNREEAIEKGKRLGWL